MNRFADLERFIQDRMSETQLPGVSIALVENAETVYQRGFGFRDSERGLPATPRTLYGIGSVTKSFTCLALMQLAEQGRLRVDDPVDRSLPLDVKPFGETVTLHHLMSHSSGIPALAYAEAVIRHAAGASDTWLPVSSYDDMLTFVNGAGDWVHARPGERWFYLNEGYILLGAVIERISGQVYAAYVRDHILQPLGMTRSFFDKAEVDEDDDVAVPYVITKDKQQIPSHYLFGRLTSDGGLISSIEDMTRYVMMYLGRGVGPRGRLAGEESLRRMMTPYVAVPPEVYPAAERIPSGHYGYGLGIYPDFYGRTLISHSGSVLVSTAYMGFIPHEGIGVVVLANGSGYPLAQLGQFALAVMLGEDPWVLPGVREDRGLERLTGRYETYRGTYGGTVTRAGDFLVLEISNKLLAQKIPLVPVSLDSAHPRFFTLAGGRRITVEFEVTERGVEMIYERYKMRRVPQ
jgi:CubicO group peptidase (beta-lactamase class C family)